MPDHVGHHCHEGGHGQEVGEAPHPLFQGSRDHRGTGSLGGLLLYTRNTRTLTLDKLDSGFGAEICEFEKQLA